MLFIALSLKCHVGVNDQTKEIDCLTASLDRCVTTQYEISGKKHSSKNCIAAAMCGQASTALCDAQKKVDSKTTNCKVRHYMT